MNRSLACFLLIAAFCIGAGCGSDTNSNAIRTEIPFRADGILEVLREDGSLITTLAIEIAEGDSARARGLMDRRSIPARGGMLFLDDEVRVQTFWMKNTPLPLDIVFVSADSQVVSIAKRTRPFSEETVSSTAPAQFVLEVRGGLTDRYGIDSTSSMRWRRAASE
jgi:uncharacterized membrane protein (UPF0127 family)